MKLVDAGMSTARINLSYGSIKENLKLLRRFKQAKRLRPHRNVGLMVDLRGREIRMSPAEKPFLEIKTGASISLAFGDSTTPSTANFFRIDSDKVERLVKRNDVLYIDDGTVVGIISEVGQGHCKMDIKIGGRIKSGCQIRFIGGKHNQEPVVRKEDLTDLAAISQTTMIDFVSLPFCVQAEDVKQLREYLGAHGRAVKLLAKIDTMDSL